MFNQHKDSHENTTVIADGVRLKGDFRGDGPMVIDGTVEGTISTTKNIDVGATAAIVADIKAGSMTVAGKIRGNIIAKERLELMAGSHIEGDVTTKSLIIAEGAILNGRCNMGATETAPIPVPDEMKSVPKPKRLASA